MAARHPSPPQEHPPVDPSLLELGLLILSASASIMTVLHELGRRIRRTPALKNRVAALREEVFRLQNSIDDLILLVQRNQFVASPVHDAERDLTQAALSFSGTLAELSGSDITRCDDLRTKIYEVTKEAYRLVQEIRKTCREAEDDRRDTSLDVAVLNPFDDLVRNFAQLSFGRFVADLRGVVRQLDTLLLDLLYGDE